MARTGNHYETGQITPQNLPVLQPRNRLVFTCSAISHIATACAPACRKVFGRQPHICCGLVSSITAIFVIYDGLCFVTLGLSRAVPASTHKNPKGSNSSPLHMRFHLAITNANLSIPLSFLFNHIVSKLAYGSFIVNEATEIVKIRII